MLKDGPNKSEESTTDQFEVWYFYGYADSAGLEAAGCEDLIDTSVACLVIMVNDKIIKAVENPLEAGALSYDVMVWSRRVGLLCNEIPDSLLETFQGGALQCHVQSALSRRASQANVLQDEHLQRLFLKVTLKCYIRYK